MIMDSRSLDELPAEPRQRSTRSSRPGSRSIKKSGGGIMHWKLMIFAGQNAIEFGAANYSSSEFVPVAPYINYISETVYYTDDPALVNSFKTRFDDLWVNSATYSGYANVAARTRSYPTYANQSRPQHPARPELCDAR